MVGSVEREPENVYRVEGLIPLTTPYLGVQTAAPVKSAYPLINDRVAERKSTREQWTLEYEGSTPSSVTLKCISSSTGRVTDSKSVGWWFDSILVCQFQSDREVSW